MTPGLALLALMLAAAPPPVATRVPTVATIERIPLPVRPGAVVVVADPLARTIALRSERDQVALAAKVLAAGGRLCPEARVVGKTVVMRCLTNRLDATLSESGGKVHLEIHELRGLPWRGDVERLRFHYDTILLGMGPCPGVNAVQRGECAFKRERLAEAALEFRAALEGDGKTLAALRLGDIALAAGDPGTAAGWFHLAGVHGPFGRLAQARLCELGGHCIEEGRVATVFDGGGLQEPVRTEMLLRAARVAAFQKRVPDMVKHLTSVVGRRATTAACDQIGRSFCRRLVMHALEQPSPEGGVEALELYLQLPKRLDGDLAIPLVRAAAERAMIVGAPVFGANLLASGAGLVETAELPEHLLRTAELYLMGNDQPRARIIAEYAETRMGRKGVTGARWAPILRELRKLNDRVEEEDALSAYEALVTEGVTDVAAAYSALVRARLERR